MVRKRGLGESQTAATPEGKCSRVGGDNAGGRTRIWFSGDHSLAVRGKKEKPRVRDGTFKF